jgi:hypothetical protein
MGNERTILNFLKFGLPTHSDELASSRFRAVSAGFALPRRTSSISTTTMKLPLSPTSPKSSMPSHGLEKAAASSLVVVAVPTASSVRLGLFLVFLFLGLGFVMRSWLNSRSKSSSCFLPRFIELTALRKFSSVSNLFVNDFADEGGFAARLTPVACCSCCFCRAGIMLRGRVRLALRRRDGLLNGVGIHRAPFREVCLLPILVVSAEPSAISVVVVIGPTALRSPRVAALALDPGFPAPPALH